jgi:Right handed beta helix region
MRKFLPLLLMLAARTTLVAKASGPVTISGEKGRVIENLKITSSKGPCMTIRNSVDVTIRNVEIGPCRGNGLVIEGGSGIRVLDSYIHPEAPKVGCCDNGNGVFARWTTNLLIQGNVIAYGESNVEIHKSTTIKVVGNLLLNPTNDRSRGANVQTWNGCQNVLVEDNYALSSRDTAKYKYSEVQEDSLSFGYTDGVTVRRNYVKGGHSASGCGIIADEGANQVRFIGNVVVDSGQCGIGISNGMDQVVDGNSVLNSLPVVGGGNTAIYVWRVMPKSPPCGRVLVSNNVASQLKPDGSESGFWNGGGCEPVTVLNNTFNAAARTRLTPVPTKLPPPLIPPKPYSCTARSPFSNQTSRPFCKER